MKTAAAKTVTGNRTIRAEQEIRSCMERWINAVGHGSPAPITSLYAPDAVLLATFDPRILTAPEERARYLTAFKARKGLKASVDECHIQILGDNAGMANGLYTFRYVADDGTKTRVKARFTFVYSRQANGEWSIVAHHSSQAPAANGNLSSSS